MYGFAVSTGETFTTATCLSFWKRRFFKLRCLALSLLGCPLPSRYVPHQPQSQATDIGYLLIEYIEESAGRMLSNTWSEKRHDDRLRGNLFRSLSQILLSITRTPLPCIGSFVIDNNGYLQLTNRPLSLEIQALENENIPTDMPRNYTYSTVDSYILDVLRIHDNRLLHQPNGINNLGDYGAQAAALTILRAALPSFFDPGLRRGPFILTFTDFNQSNFFVDEDWNVTCIVDLEWMCSLPIEMCRIPPWLTDEAVDEIAEQPEEYGRLRQELVDTLAAEEAKLLGPNEAGAQQHRLSMVMNQGWELGTFWYSLALRSPTGLQGTFGCIIPFASGSSSSCYAKYAKPGDKTGFRHIDFNVPDAITTGRGVNMIQGSLTLTAEEPRDCTEVLPGMHNHLEDWWGLVEEQGLSTDGYVHCIKDTMYTKDNEKRFGPMVHAKRSAALCYPVIEELDTLFGPDEKKTQNFINN
ncbi:hypothetical protein CIHG_04466 [Coccidioides immitis H538.4]|uniref:Aminoglycoside phosphotransferase domain-containing protein n=1 Tax=Coccidioides immitis H538.4 TaxID=396776 RepID=A0A0J8RPE8_COCIT|nr:hypothetical protein CIHG_04466 [Coccidioides immitis H538.4]